MKLHAQTYMSPILTEGTFEDVFVEETSIQLKRKDTYLRIDFDMYYIKNNQAVVLASDYLAFQGMDNDEVNSNERATFRFNDDPEETEPRGLISYLMGNNGVYPTNYTMVNWGYPTYQQALTFLTGGSFQNPEIQPLNQFVEEWIKNKIVMKGEKIGVQLSFVV